MRRLFLIIVLTVVASIAATSQSAKANPLPGAAGTVDAAIGDTSLRKGNIVKVGRWNRGRGWRHRHHHRRWKRRRNYGAIIGGIVLGAIIAGAARHAHRPYDDDLCWYWTDRYRTHGFWDYCY